VAAAVDGADSGLGAVVEQRRKTVMERGIVEGGVRRPLRRW
jgi:hypothetical protein